MSEWAFSPSPDISYGHQLPYTEETFDALHKHLPFEWKDDEKYDTVNPFGDRRDQQCHALWTFDTRNDMLRYTSATRCSQISLHLLRERAVSPADMEPIPGPIISGPLEYTFDSETPFWKPHVEVDGRMSAFANSLLQDFNYKWRHILRNNYNTTTLRVLSRGIIRLSTLDFEVRENTGGPGPRAFHGPWGVSGPRALYGRGIHVHVTDLPAWEPFGVDIVRVGTIWVVICQDIQNGLSIAQQHVASREISMTEAPSRTTSGEAHVHYMILSVKHIMLCHATDRASFKHTAPELLFNGTEPASDLALDYLIWATASARASTFTPIQSLPIEIQDMILNHSSVGTVAAAKLGCMLGLGSPFLWKDGPLTLTLQEIDRVIRPPGTSVESQILFGEHKSGIFYLALAE